LFGDALAALAFVLDEPVNPAVGVFGIFAPAFEGHDILAVVNIDRFFSGFDVGFERPVFGAVVARPLPAGIHREKDDFAAFAVGAALLLALAVGLEGGGVKRILVSLAMLVAWVAFRPADCVAFCFAVAARIDGKTKARRTGRRPGMGALVAATAMALGQFVAAGNG